MTKSLAARGVSSVAIIVAGLVATLVAVAFYVLVFGSPDHLGHFLRESGIVLLALGPPAVLTGMLIAAIQRRLHTP